MSDLSMLKHHGTVKPEIRYQVDLVIDGRRVGGTAASYMHSGFEATFFHAFKCDNDALCAPQRFHVHCTEFCCMHNQIV